MNFLEFKKQFQQVPVTEFPNKVPQEVKVSICVPTYNHEKFIKKCLDGILMQQTKFVIEILLGEDASTDGTREICIGYAKRYPDKIRLFLHHRENNIKINGSPTGRFNLLYSIYSTQGKYIALCEGDDYWIDPLKLQKQIDFLEANHEYSFSMGGVFAFSENKQKIIRFKKLINTSENEMYTLNDYISSPFSQTSSFVFRKPLRPLPDWFENVHAGDQSLVVITVGDSKIKYHKDVFSVYRINDKSITYSTSAHKVFEKFDDTLTIWNEYTNGKYKSELFNRKFRNLLEWRYAKISNPFQKTAYRLFLISLRFLKIY